MIRLPSGIDIDILIDDLRTISEEAFEILIYYSKILKDSNFKSNILENGNKDNPVTKADLKVNEMIIKKINEKYRDIDWQILSEENVNISSKECNKESEWLWVLDPLDGTKDFLQGTGNYAMHLALNYKKRPYLGVVLIPEKDQLWFAFEDKIWCEKRDGSKIKPNLSTNKTLKDMILVTSKNHKNKTLGHLIQRINFREVVVMGSIGCKLASIVMGESDIYICLSLPGKSSPKDWDFAAPESILKAAGGAITNLENEDLTYNKPNYEQGGIIVASNNKANHKNICLQIKKIIQKYEIYPLLLN